MRFTGWKKIGRVGRMRELLWMVPILLPAWEIGLPVLVRLIAGGVLLGMAV